MNRNHKALITQSVFSSIGGSEVQAIELAQHLTKLGWSVVLYAWLVESPLKEIIQSMGITVLDRDNPDALKLRAGDFDLLWIQHEVIPKSIITSMGTPESSSTRVVFSHMSPYKEVHIEQPYTYNLEHTCADIILFNAESTKDAQSSWYQDDLKRLAIYPNPAPEGFVNGASKSASNDSLSKILIVSNHAPSELEAAANILRNRGISVSHLSDAVVGDSKITTPDLLSKYDCVVTIGKTVQYCLVQSIPVFVYDRFGGPGYLSDENFDLASYYNFSGRLDPDDYSLSHALRNAESARMSAQELADNIVTGFLQAKEFIQQHRQEFIEKYSITNSFEKLMNQLDNTPKKHVSWSEDYMRYLLHNQQMVSEYVVAHHRLSDATGEFYRQNISKFSAFGTVFGADSQQNLGTLRQKSHLQQSISPGESVRIDFGESPCVITDLNIKSEKQLNVNTNATYRYEDTFFFYDPDPQIVFSLQDDGNRETSYSIDASIYPIFAIPKSLIGKLVHGYLSSTQELSRIKHSRWWKIHEMIRPSQLGEAEQ